MPNCCGHGKLSDHVGIFVVESVPEKESYLTKCPENRSVLERESYLTKCPDNRSVPERESYLLTCPCCVKCTGMRKLSVAVSFSESLLEFSSYTVLST
jgi:hypothetical protein